MGCGLEQTPEGLQHLRPQPDWELVLGPKESSLKQNWCRKGKEVVEEGQGVMGKSWSTHHKKQLGSGKDVEEIL